MDVPSVDELVLLMKTGEAAVAWAASLKPLADRVQPIVREIYMLKPAGIWTDGRTLAPELHSYEPTHSFGRLKTALKSAGLTQIRDERISDDEITSGDWIKLAYSPTIRSVGETLNFFPGKYPGGIPNQASPISSMLTSGLLGAGLGYGAGVLGEQALPARFAKGKLRRALALMGGGLGAAPGLMLGIGNLAAGLPANSTKMVDQPPVRDAWLGEGKTVQADSLIQLPQTNDLWNHMSILTAHHLHHDTTAAIKSAADDYGSGAYGQPVPASPERTSLDVNIDTMGRTLWDTGADPTLAAATMGALHAAHQLPGAAGPDTVTPGQLGRLAAGLGSGYLVGALGGAVLGALTGMPESDRAKLRHTGAFLGAVREVIPALFGHY